MTSKWGIPRSLWIIQNMSLLLWPVNLKRKDQSSASSTLVDTDRYHFRAAQNVPANMPMSSVSKTPELITRRPAGSWKCWSWCRGAKTNEGRRESRIPRVLLVHFKVLDHMGNSDMFLKNLDATSRDVKLAGDWMVTDWLQHLLPIMSADLGLRSLIATGLKHMTAQFSE